MLRAFLLLVFLQQCVTGSKPLFIRTDDNEGKVIMSAASDISDPLRSVVFTADYVSLYNSFKAASRFDSPAFELKIQEAERNRGLKYFFGSVERVRINVDDSPREMSVLPYTIVQTGNNSVYYTAVATPDMPDSVFMLKEQIMGSMAKDLVKAMAYTHQLASIPMEAIRQSIRGRDNPLATFNGREIWRRLEQIDQKLLAEAEHYRRTTFQTAHPMLDFRKDHIVERRPGELYRLDHAMMRTHLKLPDLLYILDKHNLIGVTAPSLKPCRLIPPEGLRIAFRRRQRYHLANWGDIIGMLWHPRDPELGGPLHPMTPVRMIDPSFIYRYTDATGAIHGFMIPREHLHEKTKLNMMQALDQGVWTTIPLGLRGDEARAEAAVQQLRREFW